MFYFQPVVARGETVLPCGRPLLEVKGKNATLGTPGAALRAKAGAAGSGHYLETPGGKKVEIGAVTVPLRALRAKPLATWGDDYLSLEGQTFPRRVCC